MLRFAAAALIVMLGTAPILAGNTSTNTSTNTSSDPWSSNSSSNSSSNASDDGDDHRRDERLDIRGDDGWRHTRYELYEYESGGGPPCRRCGARDDDD